jgi:hypothetical protein
VADSWLPRAILEAMHRRHAAQRNDRVGSAPIDLERRAESRRSCERFTYFAGLREQRRARRQDDLISRLARIEHPEEPAKIAADPGPIQSAVEEILRGTRPILQAIADSPRAAPARSERRPIGSDRASALGITRAPEHPPGAPPPRAAPASSARAHRSDS